jgi:hypothetical protein
MSDTNGGTLRNSGTIGNTPAPKWKCGRCGVPLEIPEQGHDCVVVVTQIGPTSAGWHHA